MLSIFRKRNSQLVTEIPVLPETNDEFAAEYDSLAQKLGVSARATTGITLAKALMDLAIPCYKIEDVEAYMDRKGHWSWFPLRQVDKGMSLVTLRKTMTEYRTLYGGTQIARYDQPVPFPVLLTVDKIVDHLGSEAVFFVAALDKFPDPFLGVMLRSDPSQFFVVERWDEPGFRGSK